MAEPNLTIVPTPTHPLFRDLAKESPFGRLTVLGYAGQVGQQRLWLCECECGTIKTFRGNNLVNGHTTSCGCFRREVTIARFKKHDGKGTITYRSWMMMRNRCLNPNYEWFEDYGGRGIKPCVRWNSFPDFLADMGKRPSRCYSLDRIDNAGGYWCGKPECPECGPLKRKPNCRWATQGQQSRNTRRNLFLTLRGTERCASEWSEITGIPASVLVARVRRGWTDERALTAPVRPCNRQGD